MNDEEEEDKLIDEQMASLTTSEVFVDRRGTNNEELAKAELK